MRADTFFVVGGESPVGAAESTPAQYEGYALAVVWRMEVTAIKET